MNRVTGNSLLNDDMIQFLFKCGDPSAKELIIWSLVSKQFYVCAHDIKLWENFAQKRSVTCCQSGHEVKQLFVEFAKIKLWTECEKSGNQSVFDSINRTFNIKLPVLSTCQSNGLKSFPMTINEKKYSFDGPDYLEINDPDSRIERIKLSEDRDCIWQPQWANVNTSMFNANDQYVVYSCRRYGCTDVKVQDLDDLRKNGSICNSRTIYSKVGGTIVNIELFTSGNIGIQDQDGFSFVNFSVLPLKDMLKLLTRIDDQGVSDPWYIHRRFKSDGDKYLRNQFFVNDFEHLSCEAREAFFYYLFEIQKPINPYSGIGEDAYFHRNGQSCTFGEKIQARKLALEKEASSFELRMKPFYKRFSELPCSTKNAIYFHLFHIQKPSQPYWGIAEDAFHHRNGQSSTSAEKIEALRCCSRVAQVNTIDALASLKLDFNHFNLDFHQQLQKREFKNSSLLKDFGITTREQFSEKLGCTPEHLQRIGIQTMADLDVLGISFCPFSHLTSFQSDTENTGDLRDLQKTAFEKKQAVVSCLENLAEKVRTRSESSALHFKTTHLPWNLLQEKISATHAELQDGCKTPKAIISTFGVESEAKIVDQSNALIDAFNALDCEHQIATLKAYVSQCGNLKAWRNLQSLGITRLTHFLQQRPNVAQDFLFHIWENRFGFKVVWV